TAIHASHSLHGSFPHPSRRNLFAPAGDKRPPIAPATLSGGGALFFPLVRRRARGIYSATYVQTVKMFSTPSATPSVRPPLDLEPRCTVTFRHSGSFGPAEGVREVEGVTPR